MDKPGFQTPQSNISVYTQQPSLELGESEAFTIRPLQKHIDHQFLENIWPNGPAGSMISRFVLRSQELIEDAFKQSAEKLNSLKKEGREGAVSR